MSIKHPDALVEESDLPGWNAAFGCFRYHGHPADSLQRTAEQRSRGGGRVDQKEDVGRRVHRADRQETARVRLPSLVRKTTLENLRDWKVLVMTLSFAPFFTVLMHICLLYPERKSV